MKRQDEVHRPRCSAMRGASAIAIASGTRSHAADRVRPLPSPKLRLHGAIRERQGDVGGPPHLADAAGRPERHVGRELVANPQRPLHGEATGGGAPTPRRALILGLGPLGPELRCGLPWGPPSPFHHRIVRARRRSKTMALQRLRGHRACRCICALAPCPPLRHMGAHQVRSRANPPEGRSGPTQAQPPKPSLHGGAPVYQGAATERGFAAEGFPRPPPAGKIL